MVIASGVEGKANYIVSGDPHLKNIKQYKKIKMVNPREFVEILSSFS